VCLAGSANLTGAALGWHDKPNLEFLARFESSTAARFEDQLDNCAIVTESIYLRYQRLLEEYQEKNPEIESNDEEYSIPEQRENKMEEPEKEIWNSREDSSEWWVPTLRHPEDLYRVYAKNSVEVTSATWEHGRRDLRHFDLPEGLDEATFKLEMRWQLLQKPVVQEVDTLVETSKRFGAVRDHLRTLPCADNDGFDPTAAWQAIMRWLLYFFDDRYRRDEANYSEIFVREE
jgi:hypothetical protein